MKNLTKQSFEKEIDMAKKSLAVFALLLAAAAPQSQAGADFVVVNNAVFNYAGFGYSDALSTQGKTEYAQSVAQRFTLDNDYTLSSLRWWGGMNNFFQSGFTNLSGFEIVIWDKNLGTKVVEQSVSIGDISSTNTGFGNQFGAQVNEFFMPFTHFLSAGEYHMNIGATYYTLNAPESPWGFGADQWLWTIGEFVQNNPETLSVTQPGIGSGWGDWYNGLPGVGTGVEGGAFVLTAPAPAGLALLGLGGFLGNRRRRN